MQIILLGASGRMGRAVAAAALQQGHGIAAGVALEEEKGGAFPIYRTLQEVTEPADVVLDFSSPALLNDALAFATGHQLPLVIAATGHSAFPLVEDGKVVGIVSRSDLFKRDQPRPELVEDIVRSDVVTAAPSESLRVAIERMLEEGVEHLPVVGDDGTLLGMCTRTDILMSQQGHMTDNRRQPGWRPPIPWHRGPRG